MRCVVLAWVALLLLASAGNATGQDYLGRTVTDVRVTIAGVPADDGNVLGVIEIRVGEPLAMRDVRATIDHLIGLGRFQDVRVSTLPTDQGVAVQLELTPVARITKISVAGTPVLSSAAIRAEVNERFGTLPSSNRVEDIVARLKAFYALHGFPAASILPRVEEEADAPERAELILTVDAGERVRINAVSVAGRTLDAETEVLRVLGLHPGEPFDQVAIESRIAKYEEDLRGRGYYEARVRETHAPAGGELSVALTITVEPGPHVSVVDPMRLRPRPSTAQ